MTLNDYANQRENVVIFWASTGKPMGDYALLGHPDWDFAESRGLLDLQGFLDPDLDWRWNGKGKPTDMRGNTITKLSAYVDSELWKELAGK
jgi:hypothetical protein